MQPGGRAQDSHRRVCSLPEHKLAVGPLDLRDGGISLYAKGVPGTPVAGCLMST